MGYLNGTLPLHDIRDVEAFCNDIIHRRHLQLTPHQHEDLLAYLIEETWELSTRYQPGGITFSTWAGNTLRRRLVDHIRTRDGRTIWRFATHTYERPRPTIISLDTELGHPQRHQHLDDPAPSDTDLDRVLRTRTGTPPPPTRPLGNRPTRRAA